MPGSGEDARLRGPRRAAVFECPWGFPGPWWGGAGGREGERGRCPRALPLLPTALHSRRLPPRAPDPNGAAARHSLGEGHEPRRWTFIQAAERFV